MIKKSNTRNSLNCSVSNLLVINKVIVYLNNKNKDTPKTLTINLALFYLLGSFVSLFQYLRFFLLPMDAKNSSIRQLVQ